MSNNAVNIVINNLVKNIEKLENNAKKPSPYNRLSLSSNIQTIIMKQGLTPDLINKILGKIEREHHLKEMQKGHLKGQLSKREKKNKQKEISNHIVLYGKSRISKDLHDHFLKIKNKIIIKENDAFLSAFLTEIVMLEHLFRRVIIPSVTPFLGDLLHVLFDTHSVRLNISGENATQKKEAMDSIGDYFLLVKVIPKLKEISRNNNFSKDKALSYLDKLINLRVIKENTSLVLSISSNQTTVNLNWTRCNNASTSSDPIIH